MPTLKDYEDIYDDESEALALELNLLGLEHYPNQTKFEGWIEYSLALYMGQEKIVQRDGSMHEDDIKFLETFLAEPQDRSSYVPMEPDYELTLNHTSEDEWTLTCMVNYGEVRHKYYGRSAIGLRLMISEADARGFAEELKRQRIALTGMVERN